MKLTGRKLTAILPTNSRENSHWTVKRIRNFTKMSANFQHKNVNPTSTHSIFPKQDGP